MSSHNDILIHDELESCPYLPDRVARLPLRVPSSALTGDDIDRRLARGERRTGDFVYETSCPSCQACQSIRLPVSDFNWSRSMRKRLRRNNQLLRVERSEVAVTAERIELFNLHRRLRNLGRTDSSIDAEDYAWAFARSCFQTFEFSYWLQDELVGVAITDEGNNSLSAVYTYYNPEHAKLSLGTWSILRQLEYAKDQQKEFLYLGFYILDCERMNYKARFLPHERMIDNVWQRFE